MSDDYTKWLVETDWLEQHLQAPDLVILDCTWHLPGSGRDAHEEYLQGRIPGALFFDIDDIAEENTDLPHMLPSPVKFSSRMRKMGIGDGTRIIVYDSHGLMSAPRVWWTFRIMGVSDVAVLNGGLKKWMAEERPTEDGPPSKKTERHFTARMNRQLVSTKNDILRNMQDNKIQVIDARPADRFLGQVDEPRPNLIRGHMPGALNVPFSELINEDGTLKKADEIKAQLENNNVDLNKPIITSCGSGITAAIVALSLAVLGHNHTSVYDGSWAEWGADDADMPIETG